MRPFIISLVFSLSLYCSLAVASVAPPGAPAPGDHAALLAAKHHLATIDDLEKRAVITPGVASEQRAHYLTAAQVALGRVVPAGELTTMIGQAQESREAGLLAKVDGWLTLTNIVIFVGACALFVGVCWLAGLYLLPVLASIPKEAYEALFYLASSATIYQSTRYENGSFLALLGCLGLLGAFAFTHLSRRLDRRHKKTYCLLLFIAWSAAALLHSSPMLGFMAVIALEAFFGFMIQATGLCYLIGFEDDKAIANGVTGSMAILSAFVAYRISGATLPVMEVFATGSLFVGAFVYFLGMLILSSKFYSRKNYPLMQLITVVSGILAIYIGSVYPVPYLRAIGGTFFFLYALEKYVELPLVTEHWAWGMFGFGAILYGGGMFMGLHPEYFLLMG